MGFPWVLHLVTDRLQSRLPLGSAITEAVRGGVDGVQVREKGQPADRVWEAVREAVAAVAAARAARALVLVNDRIDVALAAAVAGVHLSARSLPPEIARRLLPRSEGWVLGASVHSLEEARQAAAFCDYVTFGAVFGAAGDRLAELAAVVAAVDVPVLAIGGITPDNVPRVLATGCAGVAVISAILGATSPYEAAQAFRAGMSRCTVRPRLRLGNASR